MKLSIIWICSEIESDNNKTLSCLEKELQAYTDEAKVLIYALPETMELSTDKLAEYVQVEFVTGFTKAQTIAIYQDAQGKILDGYVTQLTSGDTWSEGTLAEVKTQIEKNKTNQIVMLQKIMPSGEVGAFSSELSGKKVCVQNLNEKYTCYPFYFGGTFIQSPLFTEYAFKTEYGYDEERRFFLDCCMDKGKVLYMQSVRYLSSVEREGDDTFFEAIYSADYYHKSISDFWIPYLSKIKEKDGQIPLFVQYHFMFTVTKRINSNLNNKNKHVIEEGEEMSFLELLGQAFQYIDDKALFNANKILECATADSMKWIYGIFKYGKDYTFEKCYLGGNPYYSAKETIFNSIANLKTNIAFMDYRNGKMEIDGAVHPILYAMAKEVYFSYGGKKYPLQYNERYGLTKAFGVSLYKNYSFHVTIPMENIKDTGLFCMAKIGNEPTKIGFSYESHFSRVSGRFPSSYWCFGDKKQFMAVKEDNGMRFLAVKRGRKVKQEIKLQKEMLFSREFRSWLFLLVRNAYFVAKPFMKRRPIWMYLDKIYKAGDSSEYLYRYASQKNKKIKHYYLVDKKAADYKRLRKDGFHPLVRGSVKHRLVFLMADMMVISNSTVFAFNNMGMINSSHVRDLVDFHVCCVQHGMSVQKIAVAQNRLRDNTRLYFCASKYELDNLSRPIYDYEGYDALKLTGVPRYDGLIDDNKKQIMISPTWRMQAAVPVRTSEGVQREYNPLFKQSTYYKVFNSLINDERLIDAAKKYGYKIKYVLHPIVSSQVEDFDKNEYVDIVPAVGDMSYEKMFCESSLMVTDFSGIQFDFAYMRKPLVYLHHKDIPQHYEEGTFFYDTMAFGEICHDNDELIDLLCEYMENDCKMKEEYVKRADDFFYYDDHNNCERIYNEMIAYQDKYILNKN